jgi:uncharacterized protein YceH (UPF0502 family)
MGDRPVLVLTDVEARVLGSLVEKAMATPQLYPLTLNSLVAACNQSTNRDPVVTYDDQTVDAALTSLRDKGAARLVHPSHGARTPKHRHVLDEALGLDETTLALVCVLLLRGPQTPGELRSRTERLHPFSSTDEVEKALTFLSERDPALVARLERRPGQKEARYEHLLTARRAARLSVPDYVIVVVDDLDRSLEFWTGTLGLQLGKRDQRTYAQLETGVTRVGFLSKNAMAQILGDALRDDDRFEIGFKVDDVDAAYAELLADGAISAVPPTDRPWGQRTAYLRDPDGYLVELAQDLESGA